MEEKKYYCVFCGTELPYAEGAGLGQCPNHEQHFKRMCLNCVFNVEGCCNNDANMGAAMEKIKQSVPSGYEIEELKLKPLVLRDPTKKCKNWSLAQDLILSELEKGF